MRFGRDVRFGADAHRRLSWDVVRVSAVFLVMLFHGTWVAVNWHPELGARAFQWKYAVGASTLLVVSGYFAAASVVRQNVLRWWLGRLFRILPAFWVAVVVTAVLQRAVSPAGWWVPTWPDVGANLSMLWQWKPQTYAYIDRVYWTLPLQLAAFTAMLAVAAWRQRVGGPRTAAWLWATLVVELVLWPIRVHTAWEPFRMLHDGLGWYRIHLFVIGVAIFLAQRGRIGRSHAGALVGAALALHEVQTQDLPTTAITGVCVAAVYAAAVGPDWDTVIPVAAHRPVRWLAGISYGVYLMHFSLGILAMYYLHRLGAGPGIQVLGLLATGIALGWVLTVSVERPAFRALCRWRDQALPASEGARGRTRPQPTALGRGGSRRHPRGPGGPVSTGAVGLVTFFGAVLVLAALGVFEVPRHPLVTLAALCAFAALVTCRTSTSVRSVFAIVGVCWALYNTLAIPEIGQMRWDRTTDPGRIGLLLAAALLGIALNRARTARSAPAHGDARNDEDHQR